MLSSMRTTSDQNSKEIRSQLETATRKINNYKDKVLEKVEIIRKLELELAQVRSEAPQLIENDSLQESFTSV